MKYRENIVLEYRCDRCNKPLGNHEGFPYIEDGENNYCYDCALHQGIIDAIDWLKVHGQYDCYHAVYKDGSITALKKWGKGYRRDVIRIFDPENGGD